MNVSSWDIIRCTNELNNRNNQTLNIVALINKLTDEKVVVVAHDWGGVVAWRLAIDYPHLIRNLVIINMPHPEVFSHTLKTNPVQMLRSSYAAFFQLPRLPEWIISAFGFAMLRRSLVRTSNKGTFTKKNFDAYKEVWQKPGALTAMINWYRAHKYNKSPTPVLIQLPVLLIWGENDAYLITKMAGESIKKCQNAKLEIIKGATHWVHHEQPQLINKLIDDFVSK